MPVRNQYLSNGVVVWHWRVVTGEELLSSNRELYAHELLDRFEFQLLDLSRVTDLRITTGDIQELARMDHSMTVERPRMGVVVAKDDFIFGMVRMWNIQAESSSFKTTVVRTIDEAL